MLIKCPKCNSVYDLPDNLIKDAGLAMRCAECGEIWTAYPEDSLKKNKEIKKEEWIIRASQLRMTEHIKTEQLIGLERRREEIYSEMQ